MSEQHKNTLFNFLTSTNYRVWRHLFFILAFIPIGLAQAFFVFDGYTEISTRTIYAFGIGLFITIIAFVYFNIYVLASRFLPKGEFATYLFALLVSVFLFLFLKHITEYWILSAANIHRGFNGITLLDGLSNLMLYSICIASGSISLLFKRWMAGNDEIENLKNKQLKNSIEEIKSRLRPHFLYATLDHASNRVKSEPVLISDTVFRLSEMLRYQLYDSKRDRVLLTSDIEFIRNYLVLEKQNRDGALTYTISVNGNPNKLVFPALFIPWVDEIAAGKPTQIDILFDIDTCLIKFECRVWGLDLSPCDFSKIQQEQKVLYADDIAIKKEDGLIELQLKIC